MSLSSLSFFTAVSVILRVSIEVPVFSAYSLIFSAVALSTPSSFAISSAEIPLPGFAVVPGFFVGFGVAAFFGNVTFTIADNCLPVFLSVAYTLTKTLSVDFARIFSFNTARSSALIATFSTLEPSLYFATTSASFLKAVSSIDSVPAATAKSLAVRLTSGTVVSLLVVSAEPSSFTVTVTLFTLPLYVYTNS